MWREWRGREWKGSGKGRMTEWKGEGRGRVKEKMWRKSYISSQTGESWRGVAGTAGSFTVGSMRFPRGVYSGIGRIRLKHKSNIEDRCSVGSRDGPAAVNRMRHSLLRLLSMLSFSRLNA